MNNFDQSSTGTNTELNIVHDCDLARIYFNNSIKQIGANYPLFMFTDNNQMSVDMIENHFKLDAIERVIGSTKYQDKKNMQKAVKWCVNRFNEDSFESLKYYFGISKEDTGNVVDFVEAVLEEEYGHGTVDFYNECINCELLTTNYQIVKIHSHSQTEYIDVLYIVDDNFPMTLHDMRKYLTRLFYDTPISGTITINDHELCVTDYIDEYSSWDKDVFIKAFNTHKNNKDIPPEALKQLFDMIPATLEYSE